MAYRKNVGICIINKNGLIFAGKRRDFFLLNPLNEIGWQMPQGGVKSLDNFEKLKKGMYKELYEETGLSHHHVEILQISEKMTYKFPENLLSKSIKFTTNFEGQEQIWFFLKFIGQNSDISLNKQLVPEFIDWKWVSSDFLKKHIIDMKKEIYQKILTKAENIFPELTWI